jgi:hypothetical protein
MKYACGGFVVSSSPSSTRPGCVRQVNGVGEGVSVGGKGVRVDAGSKEAMGGKDVSVGKGCSNGEQAHNPVRSVSIIVVHFVA